MIRCAAIAVVLCGIAIVPPARAQDSGLVYVQPLSVDGVRQVQSKLSALGGFPGPIDGNWGPASQSALRNFQQARGLQPTGEMNQATAATLGLDPGSLVAVTAAAAPPAPAPAYSLSADSMRIVQARLRQLGFYSGPVDATWGPGTQTALQNFQSSNGLIADGRLTKATVVAMGIDPSTMQPPQ